MAKNFIKEGKHLAFTASGAKSSGQAVVLGTLLGVALTAVENSAEGEAAVEGVWELPKASGATINAFSRPIWDVSAGEFIASGAAEGDLINAVVAVEAAGSGTGTVKAKLLPGAGSLQPSGGG